MNRTTFCGIIILLLSINSGSTQNRHILECMEIIGIDVNKYVAADISVEECDTIIDLKSGYFEIFHKRSKTKVCQVAKFNNKDSTILIGISGYYADMQCSNHPFSFYEISKSGNRFIPIESKVILPSLDFSIFFTDSKPIQILEKYLPEIKQTYLDSTAILADLMEEIYDFHIIIPKKGTKIKVTLTICDYIPRNEVSFDKEDWRIIEDHIRFIELSYDKCQKQFKRLPTKNKCD